MPQAHDLLTLLVGMALGAVAAHFHPGTITRRKRQAEATAKPKKRNPREKKAAKEPIPMIAPE